jgi:hypothetical protein
LRVMVCKDQKPRLAVHTHKYGTCKTLQLSQ